MKQLIEQGGDGLPPFMSEVRANSLHGQMPLHARRQWAPSAVCPKPGISGTKRNLFAVTMVLYFLPLLFTVMTVHAAPPDENRYTSLDEALKNPARVRRLDLSGKQLDKLPASIGRLTNLVELSLSDNKLTALPPEMGRLTKLTSLAANDNKLKSLPAEIGTLVHLDSLSRRQ